MTAKLLKQEQAPVELLISGRNVKRSAYLSNREAKLRAQPQNQENEVFCFEASGNA